MQPLRQILLDFRSGTAEGLEDLIANLSVCDQTGRCLWLAGDEAARLERLVTEDGQTFAQPRSYALDDIFDLPADPGEPDGEMDIEGLSADGDRLWIVGSHSLARRKPAADKLDPDAALARLTEVRRQPNRYFLGRLGLTAGETDGVFEVDPRRAVCLPMRRGGNALSRALRRDVHIGRFIDVPAKENGFDIEGLAARGDRLFLGLRGPVLRGWALIVEVEARETRRRRLKLRRIGPEGERYRKHFLDLDGLGIRELTFQGDDLLILAGPTMDLDGPVRLYRWAGALAAGQHSIVPRDRLEKLADLPHGAGCDHPEGIALFRRPGEPEALLVVHDSPCRERLGQDGTVRADLFALAGPAV